MSTFLFWFHILFIAAAIATGFFLPLWVILVLVVLHRLHIYTFNGCLLSKLQQRTGSLTPGQNYLQLAAQRLFGATITRRQSKLIDYMLASLPIFIALVKR